MTRAWAAPRDGTNKSATSVTNMTMRVTVVSLRAEWRLLAQLGGVVKSMSFVRCENGPVERRQRTYLYNGQIARGELARIRRTCVIERDRGNFPWPPNYFAGGSRRNDGRRPLPRDGCAGVTTACAARVLLLSAERRR